MGATVGEVVAVVMVVRAALSAVVVVVCALWACGGDSVLLYVF